MATPKGGKETAITRSMTDRIAGAASGMWNGWFGPDQPLSPIAPKEEVEGRRFDYPYGVNLAYAPRQEQGEHAVPFWLLRQIADPAMGGLDLLRIAIEKRKRQMAKLKWNLQGRDGSDGGQKARDLEIFLRKPDGARSFRVWQGMLLEDHFVTDAVAVYPRAHAQYTRLEPMDGATVKLIIDEFGRTPMTPFPAYQQFLKGVPAVDYTSDELRYYATNQRTNRIYGFSRVEQVIGMVTIALNRQLSIGSYYTTGSIPEMLLEMPASLTSKQQIKEFSDYWQSILSGNIQDRWKTRMIPAGAKAIWAKEQLLKDAFDEWLARIICFAFDLPPTSLVKDNNRSTSETAKQSSEEEGLESTKVDFKEWVDDMLARDLDAPELEYAYEEEEVVDQEANAKIVVSLFGGTTGSAKKIITLDEARDKLGYDPATAAQREELEPPAPVPAVPGGGGTGDGDQTSLPPDGATKARKLRAGRSLPPPQLGDAARADVVGRLAEQLTPHLAAMGHTLAGIIRHKIRPIAKKRHGRRAATVAKAANDDLARILAGLTPAEWRGMEDVLAPILKDYAARYAKAAARDAGTAVSTAAGDLETMLDQSNQRAVAWAAERSAALVTEIDESTRNGIRDVVTAGIDEGFTNDELADAIAGSDLFSGTRAMLIARTESANAENAGTLEGWKASGVVDGKAWIPDAEACEDCQANADDGVIPLTDTFSSGDDAPTAHPNCECTLEAVLLDAAAG